MGLMSFYYYIKLLIIKVFTNIYDMGALTLRLSDLKHQRLKALAKSKGESVNNLLDEVTPPYPG
jgi:hypothetical protein